MKNLLKVIFVLFVMGTLFACQSKKEGAAKGKTEKSGKITLAFNQDPVGNLNPHEYLPSQFITQDMVYDGLVSYGENGEIKPMLAESWKISKDGKTYTFNLRKNVKFSDGSKFDAKNVVKNFDTIFSKENKPNHSWFAFTNHLKSYRAVDDYTFEIVLDTPYTATLYDLAMIRPIRFLGDAGFPENGDTSKGIKKPVGTGAWVLKEHKNNEYAVFVRNEYYWGKKPAIKTIRVKVIPEEQTRALALEKGDIDMVFGRDMIDSESFKSEPVATRMMLINTTKGALKDKNVRKALQHVLDKKEISEGIFEGTETPADSILAKTVPYANIDVPVYNYSLDEAKKLLDAAGWVQGADGKRQKDGKPLVITLNYNADSVSEKSISEYFGQQLAKIGVELKTVGEEEQSYRDRMKKGDFDIVFNISWGIPYDPQSFLGGMRKPVYGDFAAQQGLPEKAKIDESILKGLKTTSESERAELFKYVLTTLQDEAVYIPVTYETNRAIFNDRVKNVTFGTSLYEVPYYSMNLK